MDLFFNVCEAAVDINYDKGFFDFTRWVISLVLHDNFGNVHYTASSQWIKTIKTLILLWLIYEIDILLDDAKLFRNGERCIKNQSFS